MNTRHNHVSLATATMLLTAAVVCAHAPASADVANAPGDSQVAPSQSTKSPSHQQIIWTRIWPMDVHCHQVTVSGWAIISLHANEQTPMDVSIFDRKWNLLEQFNSNGCGTLMYFAQPTTLNILIYNGNLVVQDYQLFIM